MWLFGAEHEDEELQFLRSLHKVAKRSQPDSSTNSKGTSSSKFLQDLVRDLSFWGGLPEGANVGKTVQRSRRRRAEHCSASMSCQGSRINSRHCQPSQREKKYSKTRERKLQKSSDSNDSLGQPAWKTAFDPTSGEVYYYHVITRTTQWEKPPELKAWEKKQKMEKLKEDMKFFKEMERNLRRSLKRGEVIPGIPRSTQLSWTKCTSYIRDQDAIESSLRPTSNPSERSINRIRTISGMDGILLEELKHENMAARNKAQAQDGFEKIACPSDSFIRSSRPPLSSGQNRQNSILCGKVELLAASEVSESVHPLRCDRVGTTDPGLLEGGSLMNEPTQIEEETIPNVPTTTNNSHATFSEPQHARRNTGGTIYMQNTIYNPDIDSTIKCVCGIYHAHIVQGAERQSRMSPLSVIGSETYTLAEDVTAFNDNHGTSLEKSQNEVNLPTLHEVMAFYNEFYRRSQMEHDTIIMSLIYVERLIKATNGELYPSPDRWRSILFSCMVLASKVWDDMSMWNVDFSNVSAVTAGLSSFTLTRINQLELSLLKSLNFDVRVPASEYAKYYFLIRSMLMRNGLVETNSKPLPRKIEASTFSKLKNSTSEPQDTSLSTKRKKQSGKTKVTDQEKKHPRVKSLDGILTWLSDTGEYDSSFCDNGTLCLEDLVGRRLN